MSRLRTHIFYWFLFAVLTTANSVVAKSPPPAAQVPPKHASADARQQRVELERLVISQQKTLRAKAKKYRRLHVKLEALMLKRHEHIVGLRDMTPTEIHQIDKKIVGLRAKLQSLFNTTRALQEAEDALHSHTKPLAEERQAAAARILDLEIPVGWALIPDGSFEMGAHPREITGTEKEGPRRKVTLTHAFLMSIHEVTRGLWEKVMPQWPLSPCFEGNCPITRVNWIEALAFCNALSKSEGVEQCYELRDCVYPKTKRGQAQGLICSRINFVGLECEGYRIPTEAEWEYAARADFSGARYGGLDSIAWHRDNSNGAPEPVGRKEPNAWKLHDVLGNTREWVWDWYSRSYSSSSKKVNPLGPRFDPDARKVVRGCSFQRNREALNMEMDTLSDCRLAQRAGIHGSLRQPDVGFRIVRTLTTQLLAKIQIEDGVLASAKVLLEPENTPAQLAEKERALRAPEDVNKQAEADAHLAQDQSAEEAERLANDRAEENARVEAKRQQEEKAKAIAEVKRLSEEKNRAEAEAKRQKEKRVRAEAEAQRVAEEHARGKARAKQEAELQAYADAKRQKAAEEAATKRAAKELAQTKAAAQAQTLADAKRLLREGETQLRRGKVEKALLLLAQAQALHPTPFSNYALGAAYLQVGAMEKGCGHLEQIRKTPTSIQVGLEHALIRCALHTGEFAQARKRLRRISSKATGSKSVVQRILESDLHARTGKLAHARFRLKRIRTKGISGSTRALYDEVVTRVETAIQAAETLENLAMRRKSLEVAERELEEMQNSTTTSKSDPELESSIKALNEERSEKTDEEVLEAQAEPTASPLSVVPEPTTENGALRREQDESAIKEAKRIAKETRAAAKMAQQNARQAKKALRLRKEKAVLLSRKGRRLLKQGATDAALEKLTEAYGLFPHPHTTFALAVAYMRKGNWTTSISFIHAIGDSLPSKEVEKAHILSRFALSRGEYEEAQGHLDRARKLTAKDSANTQHILEASLHLQQKDVAEAEVLLGAIPIGDLDFDQKDLYQEVEGQLAELKAKSARAAAESARVQEIAEKDRQAEVRRDAAMREERTAASLARVISEPLRITPIQSVTTKAMRTLLSAARMRNEDLRIARRIARSERQAARKNKFKAVHLSRKGQRLLRNGKFDEALALLTEANNLHGLPETTFALAQLHLETGSWAKGCVLIQETEKGLPNDKYVQFKHAVIRCAFSTGNIEKGAEQLKAVRKLEKGQHKMFRALLEAELHIHRNELPAARKRLNRIAERRMRRNERNYFDIVEALLSERAHEIASLETTEFPGKSLNESAIEDVAALALKMELEKAEQDRVESQQTSAATKAQQDKLFQEAFAATQEALRTKRQSRAAELSRSGRRLLNGGEFDRALTLLTEAFSLYPHPKTEFALARIYMLRGAWSEARTHLLKARPLLPSQKVAISQGLARCALRQNDLKTAQNSIRKLRQLKLSGSEQQMLQLLEADLLIRKGKIVRATKRLASISEKKLNAELKVIYSDLQTRLEAAKRESTKFAQDAKESTQIHPSPIPQHKSHDIQHRGTTRIKPISTGT